MEAAARVRGVVPHFRPRRHLMTATEYHTEMTTRSAT